MRFVAVTLICALLLAAPLTHVAVSCTSFVMDTPEGPIFGANLDLFIPGDGLLMVNRRGIEKQGYQTGTTGESALWTSKYGSVTFNLAGNQFVWAGMNEAGLTISSMELRSGEYPKRDERPSLFKGNWGQYVLDTCGSVEEVIATDALTRLEDQGPTDHYLVADAEGNTVAIEYLDGEFVYFVDEDLPVRAMTNIRYERALYAYEEGGMRWWWSNPGASSERFAACQKRAESFDAGRDTSAVDYAFGTLLYYVAAPHTRWSIVNDIAAREFWFRSDQNPVEKHVSLDDFDFSCDAPKLMLDVNAQLEGDVADDFVPYDPAVNLDVFWTFCDRYGLEVSEKDARDLTRFFDAFECAR